MPWSFCAMWKRRGRQGSSIGPVTPNSVGQRNRPHPFNLGFAGFGARDIDGDAGPRAAAIGGGAVAGESNRMITTR